MRFDPPDPDFAARVRASFDRQAAMKLIGAALTRVEPGHVVIELPFRADLTQQHGFIHGGMTAMIADSAAGYAAYTLFPAGSSVLTVEFKINLVAPADGERLVASARVKKTGRTLTICEFEVGALKQGRSTTCALGLQTLICLAGRPDTPAMRSAGGDAQGG
ncbi:MAG: PaaI family thioesterase [Burkholderiales bacterium]